MVERTYASRAVARAIVTTRAAATAEPATRPNRSPQTATAS